MPLDLHLNDVARLRKPHPCGGYDWRVVRLGADIGLRCLTCNRRVLLPRREMEKRLKTLLTGDEAAAAVEVARAQESREEGAQKGSAQSRTKGRRA